VIFSFVSFDKNVEYTSYLFVSNMYSANQFFLDVMVRILFYRDIKKIFFCLFVQLRLCLSVCLYDWQTISILLDFTTHRFNRCTQMQMASRKLIPWFYQAVFLIIMYVQTTEEKVGLC
jgi:hypothetical protein